MLGIYYNLVSNGLVIFSQVHRVIAMFTYAYLTTVL